MVCAGRRDPRWEFTLPPSCDGITRRSLEVVMTQKVYTACQDYNRHMPLQCLTNVYVISWYTSSRSSIFESRAVRRNESQNLRTICFITNCALCVGFMSCFCHREHEKPISVRGSRLPSKVSLWLCTVVACFKEMPEARNFVPGKKRVKPYS